MLSKTATLGSPSDLRDAVNQRLFAAELLQARDEAERASLAKSRFLATALQSLFLLKGTLRRMVSGPKATDAVVQQEQAIGTIAQLLNALLETSRFESMQIGLRYLVN